MSGFCIFRGILLEQTKLKEKLEDYSKTKKIGKDSLKENVDEFKTKSNGTICFDFIWDSKVQYTHRGTPNYALNTSTLNVRIIPYRSTLYYLIEKGRNREISHAVRRLLHILYNDSPAIEKIQLTSGIIKEIEDEDSRELRAEALEKLTARDKSMILFGTLEIRDESGTTSRSPVHDRYHEKPKYYSNFVSISYRADVFISGKEKKNQSVTLRGRSLDSVESYIREYVLPKL